MAQVKLKVKNGTLTLPRSLQRTWKGAEVFVLPTEDDTLIIKKVQKPIEKLSEIASHITSPKMTRKEIDKEIQAYRRGKIR